MTGKNVSKPFQWIMESNCNRSLLNRRMNTAYSKVDMETRWKKRDFMQNIRFPFPKSAILIGVQTQSTSNAGNSDLGKCHTPKDSSFVCITFETASDCVLNIPKSSRHEANR